MAHSFTSFAYQLYFLSFFYHSVKFCSFFSYLFSILPICLTPSIVQCLRQSPKLHNYIRCTVSNRCFHGCVHLIKYFLRNYLQLLLYMTALVVKELRKTCTESRRGEGMRRNSLWWPYLNLSFHALRTEHTRQFFRPFEQSSSMSYET